jgi:hypothetical protein
MIAARLDHARHPQGVKMTAATEARGVITCR